MSGTLNNKLAKLLFQRSLPNICKQAGLRKVYNNHSLRATSIVCTLYLFTNALDSAYGGYFCGKWFQDFFPMDMFNTEEKPSMAYYELYSIVMAYVLLGQQL